MIVYLVRHAQSNFDDREDHLRPLSDLGQYQAQLSAQFLKQQIGSNRALIISSFAVRTMQTANIIKDQLSHCEIVSSEKYYGAQSGDWCDALINNKNSNVIILVGHNPTMGRLSGVLNEHNPKRFSPACVAQYDLEIVQDGLKLPAQLLDFYIPNAE